MTAGGAPVEPADHLQRRAHAGGVRVRAWQIDAEKVVAVALNPDDELRNLQVALLYSLTSNRMDERFAGLLGSGEPRRPRANANWFTIAQWAVLTVGRNLRTTAMPHRASVLPEGIRRRLTPAVLNLRSADDRRVAAALSYGQVMVFASVYHALLKTNFADTETPPTPYSDVDGPTPDVDPQPDPEPDPEPDPDVSGPTVSVDITGLADMVDSYVTDKRLAAHEEEMTDISRRRTVLELAGQLGADVSAVKLSMGHAEFYEAVLDAIAARGGYEGYVLDAFALYERAAPWCPEQIAGTERSPADLIFEANLRIAAVEQVILDEAVTMVVDHVPRHVAEQAEGRLATFAERSLRVPRRIAQINSSSRLAGASAVAKDVWARVMTDQVMVVAFPSETIRLGRDIPRKDWRHPFYAPELLELSPEAAALFDQFDRSLGDGRGAGAGDWRRFDDRMNFVANLLRSRQQDSTLFWQPFTDEDVARVWNGAYPVRVADPFEQAVRAPSFPSDLEDLDTVSCEEISGQQQMGDGGGPLAGEEPTP